MWIVRRVSNSGNDYMFDQTQGKKPQTLLEEIFDEIKPSTVFSGIIPEPPSPSEFILAPVKKFLGNMKEKED